MQSVRQIWILVMALPGRKILLRGNHDMFWDAKKTENLNEMSGEAEFCRIIFTYEDYALWEPRATVMKEKTAMSIS